MKEVEVSSVCPKTWWHLVHASDPQSTLLYRALVLGCGPLPTVHRVPALCVCFGAASAKRARILSLYPAPPHLLSGQHPATFCPLIPLRPACGALSYSNSYFY